MGGQIFHIYTTGRFGPERHLGFVEAADNSCLKTSTHITFDIVQSPTIPDGFFRNPLGIQSIKEFRKWQRNVTC